MSTSQRIQQLIASAFVVVFSKSYCPFCDRVKRIFRTLGVSFKVIELDQEKDGAAMQTALYELTRQRTVPNVFIDGQHVGGCDQVMELERKGALKKLLEPALTV
ncbi:Glutaredoxin-C6 [Galdieria sulphuraria]|uniref:Glutaredoxin n=1 Tax=Galdieria sulphuraria TaxID=130081 RepID=M2Y796_GALSU|nr:glutaredoxin [Galdieria sulphuraria]EME31714.1 glutaredoxin [Galdieria sulphuraria]GJD10514.1 Glutaredoxin-C6 [Galdieria sulphuraria]|eukprot:XP_005708234.1 glutaredoxin [Galdieria sulphuraria]